MARLGTVNIDTDLLRSDFHGWYRVVLNLSKLPFFQMYFIGSASTSGLVLYPPTRLRQATPAQPAKNASFLPTNWFHPLQTLSEKYCQMWTGLDRDWDYPSWRSGWSASRTSLMCPVVRGPHPRANQCLWERSQMAVPLLIWALSKMRHIFR